VIAAALSAVSKRFGQAVALDRVDLAVEAGEVVALLGPNGAGKTTALSILLGLRRPDEGRAEVFGVDPRRPSARVSVAVAFAGEPAAIFLDEPTAGLDVESRRSVWAEIDQYAADGGTVLLTTHYLEEAERLARRIVLLARGRVVAEGTADALAGQARVPGLEEAFLALTEAEI
jgi:ABC-2 type transport system ATP-binding protein